MKKSPTHLHSLRILSPTDAAQQGYVSITIDISHGAESKILAGVCQHRNPDRACLIRTSDVAYQLGIKREDVSNLAD